MVFSYWGLWVSGFSPVKATYLIRVSIGFIHFLCIPSFSEFQRWHELNGISIVKNGEEGEFSNFGCGRSRVGDGSNDGSGKRYNERLSKDLSWMESLISNSDWRSLMWVGGYSCCGRCGSGGNGGYRGLNGRETVVWECCFPPWNIFNFLIIYVFF